MDTINHNSLLSTRFISFPGFMDTQPDKRRDLFRFGFRVFYLWLQPYILNTKNAWTVYPMQESESWTI